MNPPTGTVTFLFTDIEGSTQLWERETEKMRAALPEHDALMQTCVQECGGYLFKTVGDGVYAAFDSATDAVRAALTAQIRLKALPERVGLPIRVRMALHTGPAEFRGGDYFGPSLNRLARLLALGHGGQVLLSGACEKMAAAGLPDGAGLIDAGSHRLKDLQQPERVYQLIHPEIESAFPPLRSLDAASHNLPLQLTSFVGREKELQEIRLMLGSTRLLTLTGSGGAGKSRLALQVAAELADDFPDGVWYVELAPVADPALVPQTVATALGIREIPGRPLQETLIEYLRPRKTLLLMDNCEHLLTGCALLADALLKSGERLAILATSRERLAIPGERTYRVPSLDVPKETDSPERLERSDSVRLFLERAQLAQPQFSLTDRNARAVAQICRRLDGIPLALELAAARVRTLPVEQIAARLDDRFRLLTGGSRVALPRHHTLQNLIGWSYELLTELERALLRRISVFAGGFTLEAAECVAADEAPTAAEPAGATALIEAWQVLDLLSQLVDKSLVTCEQRESDMRYGLLETIRQYSRDRLIESGEAGVIRDRHLFCYLTLAEQAEEGLLGPRQSEWLNRLETEHDNLRAALAWSLDSASQPSGPTSELTLRLAGALWRFWDVRGHYQEAREWLDQALQASMEPSAARAFALTAAGNVADTQGRYADARALHQEALDLFRRLGHREGEAGALNLLGLLAFRENEYDESRSLLEQGLAMYRELRDSTGIANCLINLGNLKLRVGDYESASRDYEESGQAYRAVGNQRGVAASLINQANIAQYQGDFAFAVRLIQEAEAIYRALGDRQNTAIATFNLGDVARSQRDYAAATEQFEKSVLAFRELNDAPSLAQALLGAADARFHLGDEQGASLRYQEGLQLARRMGDERAIAEALEGIAELALDHADYPRAVTLWAAADAIRNHLGAPLPPPLQQERERSLAQARQALEAAAFETAWTYGADLSPEEAASIAIAG